MDADSDPHRCRQLGGELAAQRGDALGHRPGGRQRLAAPGGGPVVDAEERHHAVAGELVGDPAGAGDGGADRREVAVEDEHDVVRQFVLGHAREAAEIGEQDRQLALASLTGVGRHGRGRLHGRHHERPDRNIADRSSLTREPYVRRGADAREHAPLGVVGQRELSQAADDPHATGRAAPAASADRGVRDAAEAARLEDREPTRCRHHAAVRVGDPNGASSPREAADSARDQDADQRREVRVQEGLADGHEHRGLGRAWRVRLAQQRVDPAGRARQRRDLTAGRHEAEKRQHR